MAAARRSACAPTAGTCKSCHGRHPSNNACMNHADQIAELTGLIQRAFLLETVGSLLGWDEQVNLPAGAAEQRARQHAVLAEAQQAAASAPRIGELLGALEARRGELTADQQAIVHHARRDYDRATKLPPEFVREKA